MINIPFFLLAFMCVVGLGINMGRHGKPRKEKYNAWMSLLATILEVGLATWAVYWGFR